MKKGLEAVINASQNTLELRITGRIYHGWSASDFRYEIDQALRQGIKKGVLYLNTEGGSVFEASEIVNQLRRLQSVEIQTGALVASAGTYIMSHFTCKAFASSQFMIHKPLTYFEGNIDQMRSDMKLLENLTSQYKKVYAKRFNRTEDEIDELWKQDYWFTADEALSLGLIGEIVDGEPIITEDTIAAFKACGGEPPKAFKEKVAQIQGENQNSNKSDNNTKMDRNVLIASLGMSADATDEQIQARISELKQNEQESKAAAQARAEKLVNQAIFDKKITADKKDAYVKLAIADYDSTQTLLSEMEAPKAASQGITPNVNAEAERSGWTMEDYLDRDPEALEKLIADDPEKVKELNAAYAKSK